MTQERSSKISPLLWVASISKELSRWYGQAQHTTKGKRGKEKEKWTHITE